MLNDIERHGKNLMIYKILIRTIIAQIIVMLMLINIKSNVERS